MKKTVIKKAMSVLFLAVAVPIFALFAYAHFSASSEESFNCSVNIELLFDRLNQSEDGALAKYQRMIYEEKLGKNAGYIFDLNKDGTAEEAPDGSAPYTNVRWGTEYNPYVISDVRHLQNLSTLTNSGYFDKFFNSDSDTTDIPHFLLCTTDGKKVLVDATGKTIAPIGNDLHPFIGSLRGAVLEDSEGSGELLALNTSSGSITSDTSVIYNVTVEASSGYHDIGLFGHMSYTRGADAGDGTFEGTPSRVEDILLADVKIRTTHSLIGTELIGDWLNIAAHTFKIYVLNDAGEATDITATVDGNSYTVFRETHHIGILAGHVDYTTVKNVSIYYSDEEICAIDISADAEGSDVNYYSHTGILGTLNNLNTSLTMDEHGKSFIDSDGGISDANINFGLTGGGGLLTGVKPGYILAENMFSLYSYNHEDGNLLIYNAKNKTGDNLCVEETREYFGFWQEGTGNYYFTDGVFTFALSSKEDTIQKIWESTIPTLSYGPDSSDNWTFTEDPDLTAYLYSFSLVRYEDLPSAGVADPEGGKYLAFLADASGNLYIINLSGTTSSGGLNVALKDSAQINDVGTGGFINVSSLINAEGGVYELYSSNGSVDSFAVEKSTLGNTFRSVSSTGKSFGLGGGYQNGFIGIGAGEKYASFASNSSSYKPSGWFQPTYQITYNHTVSGSATEGYLFSGSVTFEGSNGNVTRTLYPSVGSSAISVSTDSASTSRLYFAKYTVKNETPGSYEYTGSDGGSFPLDSYVLWPTNTYAGSDVWAEGDSASTDTYIFEENPENYTLVKLSELNWNYADGKKITDATHTNRMFNMKQGITWGVAANILGLSIGTEGLINAPVGSDGTKYNIPTGCIALKVSELTNSETLSDGTTRNFGKIRVIVAVPSTDTNISPSGEDCFFGIWRGGKDTSSGISVNGFQRRNAQQLMRMPMSFHCANTGYQNNSYVNFYLGEAESINLADQGGKGVRSVVTNSTTDTTLYRSYLSGQVALIAYEFEIDEAGSYIIGSSNTNMQIVYFSADGVASEGSDGTGKTGQLGSLDFVYTNSDGKVLTVKDGDPNESPDELPNTYYYPSYWLVHLNNMATANEKINNEKIYIYRYLANGSRYVNVTVDGDGHVAHSAYNSSADTPSKDSNGTPVGDGSFPNRKSGVP